MSEKLDEPYKCSNGDMSSVGSARWHGLSGFLLIFRKENRH